MGTGKTALPSGDRDFANILKGMPCCFNNGCHDDLGVLFTGMEWVEKTQQGIDTTHFLLIILGTGLHIV